MKKFLLLIFCLALVWVAEAQQSPSHADTVLREACELAGKENKNVMVIFTASWCVWCKRMTRSIEDSVCRDYFNQNYVIRHLVVDEFREKKHLENPGADQLKTRYGGGGRGIPYWLVFDKDGKLIGDCLMVKPGESPDKADNSGCPATEKEVEHFIRVLQKTSRIQPGQVDVIRKRFRENDK